MQHKVESFKGIYNYGKDTSFLIPQQHNPAQFWWSLTIVAELEKCNLNADELSKEMGFPQKDKLVKMQQHLIITNARIVGVDWYFIAAHLCLCIKHASNILTGGWGQRRDWSLFLMGQRGIQNNVKCVTLFVESPLPQTGQRLSSPRRRHNWS